MIRLALRSALSDRASENKVLVVDSWDFDSPKTKDAMKALEAIGAVEGRALVVLDSDDAVAARSFRNLPHVQLIRSSELNAYDILCNEWIVFTKSTLPTSSDETQRAQSFGPQDVDDSTSGDEGSASDEEQPSERSERGQAEGSAGDEEQPSERSERGQAQ